MTTIYILILVCILVIFFVLLHKIQLKSEQKKIIHNGKIVQVDGYNMHVYSEGERQDGLPTIVVMSGSSMPSPVYNYKQLYSRLSDTYHIVVPEKLGYGYSDIASSPRDVETILEQTRKALQLAGEKAPYVLMPHSMSGIEAQLWSLKYPKEILGIVGLDMALPSHYEDMNLGARMKAYKLLSGIVRHIGFQRLSCVQKALEVHDKEVLSPIEWKQEKYLINKMTLNKMIYEEGVEILKSARLVNNLGVLNTPMLLFVSDGTVGKDWVEHYKKYIAIMPSAKMIELDCGHMMHKHCSEIISDETKKYIAKLI